MKNSNYGGRDERPKDRGEEQPENDASRCEVRSGTRHRANVLGREAIKANSISHKQI
jgi:hypothetical protein